VKNHTDIAAVDDEHPEHAGEQKNPTNDYKHSGIVTGKPEASRVEEAGLLRLVSIISSATLAT
jgi:hypothetical protein